MSYLCLVDPTRGNRQQWQDFSSTRTLLLRWRPHHEKLSALDPSHSQTEAKETMLPRTHSRSPTALMSHPRDKQEEETAAGTDNEGRTSTKATMIRHKIQAKCSLSIRRISLLHPPAAGGEHLPSHSQITSASTLPSGLSSARSKERLSLVGPLRIPGMMAGSERPHPDNKT